MDHIEIKNKQKCCGCYACFNICPVKAITMQEDEEGFFYPQVSKEGCIGCGKCVEVCPVVHSPKVNRDSIAYACYAKNSSEHMSSSSGGIFSVLARQFLNEDGIVYGAAFDTDMLVKHCRITSLEDLYLIKGTKYVQSLVRECYTQVKEDLRNGKQVLFSGTPCQIAGLIKYLGRKDEKLLCIDLICHGVPSPGIWKRYLSEQFGRDNVIGMHFRNKIEGIHRVTLDYQLRNGEIAREKYESSPYIMGFIANLFIRPSCFSCKFKGIHRVSDMTIGDFWSIREFHQEMDNQYGVSSVIIHTDNGKRWFRNVLDEIVFCEATPNEVVVWNESMVKSAQKSRFKKEFYELIAEKEMAGVILELTGKDKKEKEKKSRLKNLMRRMRLW